MTACQPDLNDYPGRTNPRNQTTVNTRLLLPESRNWPSSSGLFRGRRNPSKDGGWVRPSRAIPNSTRSTAAAPAGAFRSARSYTSAQAQSLRFADAAKLGASEYDQTGLQTDDVLSLQTFRSLLDFEFHCLAFVERLVPFRLDRRKVHKHIFSGLALNETKTLRCVKPLHCSLFFSHLDCS